MNNKKDDKFKVGDLLSVAFYNKKGIVIYCGKLPEGDTHILYSLLSNSFHYYAYKNLISIFEKV